MAAPFRNSLRHLPTFVGRRVADSNVNVGMFEFQQRLLPDSFYRGLADPYSRGSYVWVTRWTQLTAGHRQLVLFEYEDPLGKGQNTVGTPIEDLVNNTKWTGRRDGGTFAPIPGSTQDEDGQDLWTTERPRVGSTEVWELWNPGSRGP